MLAVREARQSNSAPLTPNLDQPVVGRQAEALKPVPFRVAYNAWAGFLAIAHSLPPKARRSSGRFKLPRPAADS